MAKLDQKLGGSLTARIESREGIVSVALSGNVTELANFSSLRTLGSRLRFDLGGIERINSLGVRGWVHFVRDCENAGIELTFERVSPVMVQQISMITGFMGTRSVVRSLLAPYVCPKCNAEELHLVEVPPDAPPPVPASIPCPKCRTAMQLDELEDMYANLFARQQQQQRQAAR